MSTANFGPWPGVPGARPAFYWSEGAVARPWPRGGYWVSLRLLDVGSELS